MMNIARYEPFGDAFDGLLKGFFVRPMGFEGRDAAPQRIKVDVSERDSAYLVRAEIPGVKKEDIEVNIDGDQVSISAETHAEAETKEGERVLHRERYYGKIERVFRLGSDIDQSAANAKYADGVLELVLPKKPDAARRQLTIQ